MLHKRSRDQVLHMFVFRRQRPLNEIDDPFDRSGKLASSRLYLLHDKLRNIPEEDMRQKLTIVLHVFVVGRL